MKTVQVVIDAQLLRAADGAAQRARINRSAFVREALRAHLKHLRRRELEEQDWEGYRRHPASADADWEKEASWPEP